MDPTSAAKIQTFKIEPEEDSFLRWTKYNPWLSNVQFLRPRWSEHSRGVQDWEHSLSASNLPSVRDWECLSALNSPSRHSRWVFLGALVDESIPLGAKRYRRMFYKCAHSSGRHRFCSPPCPEASRTYTNKYSHSPNYPKASRTQNNKCNHSANNWIRCSMLKHPVQSFAPLHAFIL